MLHLRRYGSRVTDEDAPAALRLPTGGIDLARFGGRRIRRRDLPLPSGLLRSYAHFGIQKLARRRECMKAVLLAIAILLAGICSASAEFRSDELERQLKDYEAHIDSIAATD